MTNEERNEVLHHIKVEKAYLDGKTIQVKKLNEEEWHDIGSRDTPAWSWLDFDYRVKPEPPKLQYCPFKNAEELIEAIKEHGYFLRRKSTGSSYMIIREFDDEYIWIGMALAGSSFISVFENYTFADGTQFGKLI